VRGRPRYRPAYAARLAAGGPEAQFAGLMAANGQERADYRSLTWRRWPTRGGRCGRQC